MGCEQTHWTQGIGTDVAAGMKVSCHAARRMRQRGLSHADVAYVMKHGQKWHVADAVIFFLRNKDMPYEDRHLLERLCGTAVVVARTNPVVITVWRNRKQGLQHIKRKPPTSWQMPMTGEPEVPNGSVDAFWPSHPVTTRELST